MDQLPRVPRSVTCLKLTGSHYDIGYELGMCIGKEIRDYLAEMSDDINNLKRYTDSAEGRKTYERFLNTVTSHYPLYRRELEGTADGAGVEFEKLFLLNIEPELTALYGDNYVVEAAPSSDECRHYPQSNGCTDIYIRNPQTNTFVLGHSEDGPPAMDKAGVWLDVDITDTWNGKTVKERFMSFTKAGSIPGSMFNIMAKDLMSGGNNIYQKTINKSGIPRRFFMRAILSANNYQDVVNIVEKSPGVSSGFNINLIHSAPSSAGSPVDPAPSSAGSPVHPAPSSAGSPVHPAPSSAGSPGGLMCTCIEIAGHTDGVWKCITPCGDFFTNTNLFNHLTVPHYQEESSVQRQLTLESWRAECKDITKRDVIRILSNQDNSSFPVFRTGEKPDYISTGCVAIFDLNTMVLDVYSDKPDSTDPIINIDIKHFQ
ncbi:uncharacterized protein LOC117341258 [Pecten maximus]|uniref:uncharacterized protein LOC117341258 n=1 Tax=Pecten maximus TaxID=6579 RepID=UPI0014586277|nr:uncharacterized protein LOC117341258 [Pecten maximus]